MNQKIIIPIEIMFILKTDKKILKTIFCDLVLVFIKIENSKQKLMPQEP